MKSGVGIASIGIYKPEIIMKYIIPVVIAGILGIYGMIVAVILTTKSKNFIEVKKDDYDYFNGYAHMAAGICCGFSSMVICL